MLSVEKLSIDIAGIRILSDVYLRVGSDEIAGLVGRNGAGKTTLMRSIMGLTQRRSGSIMFDGQDLARIAPHQRARIGVGYMPEDRRLVPALTVEENLLVPAWATGADEVIARLAWVYELLPEVREFRDRSAAQLSGGQQKLVALARALLVGRRLLMLDEPFEGVAPVLARRLAEAVARLKGQGLSVLLSESDFVHAADLVTRLFVIERGVVREIAPGALAGLHIGERP
jgi:branched-chain amino acid transport system ATP-binding protein